MKALAVTVGAGALLLVLALALSGRGRRGGTTDHPVADSDTSPPVEVGTIRRAAQPLSRPSRAAASLSGPARTSPASGETSPSEAPSEPEPSSHPYLTEDLLALDDSYEPETVFNEAAGEFRVPADLLKAVAYVESGGNHRHGVQAPDGGFGVMKLRETTSSRTLEEAAKLLGTEKTVLVRDPAQNIRGAAALIKVYHDEALRSGQGPNPWLVAVTLYSGRPPEEAIAYAREIENILHEGLTHTTDGGQLLYINPGQDQLIAREDPEAQGHQ